jgi:hypothetical protein
MTQHQRIEKIYIIGGGFSQPQHIEQKCLSHNHFSKHVAKKFSDIHPK